MVMAVQSDKPRCIAHLLSNDRVPPLSRWVHILDRQDWSCSSEEVQYSALKRYPREVFNKVAVI